LRPLIAISLAQCAALVKEGFRLFMDTKLLQVRDPFLLCYCGPILFQESESVFRSALTMVPLLPVQNAAEVKEANNIIASCREYIVAARLALAMQNVVCLPAFQ
jgi:hypothetical protein